MRTMANVKLRPFRCEICSRSYSTKLNLMKHLKSHPEAQLFKCEVCRKQYTCNDSFRIHSCVHCEKQFSCKVCNETFNSKNDLRIHLMTHLQKKDYDCKICLQIFSSWVDLKAHLKTHVNGVVLNDILTRYSDSGEGFSQQRKPSYHNSLHPRDNEIIHIPSCTNEMVPQEQSYESDYGNDSPCADDDGSNSSLEMTHTPFNTSADGEDHKEYYTDVDQYVWEIVHISVSKNH